jgi:hypothetical protein
MAEEKVERYELQRPMTVGATLRGKGVVVEASEFDSPLTVASLLASKAIKKAAGKAGE